MSNPGILFNYHLLTPLISFLSPENAYKICSVTGAIGKSIEGRSYRYDSDNLIRGLNTICNILDVDQKTAINIIKRFFHIENRVQLEHIWLARRKLNFLSQMVDMGTLKLMADEIRVSGPSLIVTAHTAYYFLLPWALHSLGLKIAYVMANPRLSKDNSLLKGISAVDAMEQIIPLIYTNDINTVKRCVDFLTKDYSVIIVIDIPSENKGIDVRLMNRDVRLRTGYASVCNIIKPSVYAVFSYVKDLTEPYKIIYKRIKYVHSGLIAQEWAKLLEQVIKDSPESWLGWFYFWQD